MGSCDFSVKFSEYKPFDIWLEAQESYKHYSEEQGTSKKQQTKRECILFKK